MTFVQKTRAFNVDEIETYPILSYPILKDNLSSFLKKMLTVCYFRLD